MDKCRNREPSMNKHRQSVVDQRRLLADDRYRHEVYEMLVLNCYRDISIYCARYFKGIEGEEITQEIFLRAWKKLSTFDGRADISTWLFSIAKNQCNQEYRNYKNRRRIRKTFQDNIGYLLHYDAGRSSLDKKTDREQADVIVEGLARLKESDRVLMKLRFTEGHDVKYIADLTGKSKATIQRRLAGGIKRLREWIHDNLD